MVHEVAVLGGQLVVHGLEDHRGSRELCGQRNQRVIVDGMDVHDLSFLHGLEQAKKAGTLKQGVGVSKTPGVGRAHSVGVGHDHVRVAHMLEQLDDGIFCPAHAQTGKHPDDARLRHSRAHRAVRRSGTPGARLAA